MSESADLPDDPRAALALLAIARREDYAGLSRLIGRNPAYIQQYVKRGSPRRLAEADRRILADYFGVAEAVLGGPIDEPARIVAGIAAPIAGARADPRRGDPVAIPRYDLAASAGAGALEQGERRAADLHFPAAMLRALGARSPASLSLVRVRGDSMLPALGDGDDILVDRDDAADRLRNGVYVLRHDDALIVKRVRFGRGGFAVVSDNKAYPSWRDADPAAFTIVGRVLWAGGRLR